MKIAVVGAGISGIGAAWLLSQKHDVHLFESEKRLGGHAHTVHINEEKPVAMDTGFLVYNELTYPHLTAFFRVLGVETVASDMSLSVQSKHKNLEWSGTSLNSVFGQRSNLLNLRFHRMLLEILRFGREAQPNLHLSRRHAWSLRDLLNQRKYSAHFVADYLLPIGAAIWSTPNMKMFDFPAETFLNFFINHKLLQVNHRPIWRTVLNGSIQYVQKAAVGISKIYLDAAVLEVERRNGKVLLKTAGDSAEYDQVVLATHAPITAQILKNPLPAEQKILASFRYEANQAVLHQDAGFMPKNKICWSSWNVSGADNIEQPEKVSLTYHLNQLQPLKSRRDYFLTLNPSQKVNTTLGEFNYSHPQFDRLAIRAQNDLPSIQGQSGIYFAGAWSRYGFHEDGLLSAVQVAKAMGVSAPWEVS